MALHSGTQLSAMERMARQLQEITSYSYRSTGGNTGLDDDGRLETRRNDSTVSWLAPNGFRQETKIVKIVEDVGGGNRTEEVLAHFDEIFPPGGHGSVSSITNTRLSSASFMIRSARICILGIICA